MVIRGGIKIPRSRITKDLNGNIGKILLKVRQQVTKCHFDQHLVVPGNYIVCIHRGNSPIVKCMQGLPTV